MYIRIPISLITNNPFKTYSTLFLYSYFANMAKDGKDTTTIFATNKNLDGIFDFAHMTYWKSFKELCEDGFAVNNEVKTKFYKNENRFVSRRNITLDCKLYQKYDESQYITVQSEWLTEWKLPLKACIILGILWSWANVSKDPVVEFWRDDFLELANIYEKTYRKYIKLLEELGLVTRLCNKRTNWKSYKLNEPVLSDKENSEELLEDEKLMEVAKEVSTTTASKTYFVNWVKRVLKAKSSKMLEKVYAFLCPSKEVPSVVDKLPWLGLDWYEVQAQRASWKAEQEELEAMYYDIYGGYAY